MVIITPWDTIGGFWADVGGTSELDVINHFENIFSGKKLDTLHNDYINSYSHAYQELNWWRQYWLDKGAPSASVNYYYLKAILIIGKYWSPSAAETAEQVNIDWTAITEIPGNIGEGINNFIDNIKRSIGGVAIGGILAIAAILILVLYLNRK